MKLGKKIYLYKAAAGQEARVEKSSEEEEEEEEEWDDR